jgi:2-polyprenyl-3-methyl-5-hydroxy-6-metoxy-1,4-benzoquinol methylase
MGLFRIKHNNFEESFNMEQFDTEHQNEWEDVGRVDEGAWVKRYEYEASLIEEVIKLNPHIKTVLEIGSGPGILSQHILKKFPDLEYDLVDKPFAKKYFDDNNFKGRFFIKDLSNSFDTTELRECYDLVIANDFLEHVYNPHIIIKTIYELTNNKSVFFVSNPNWRMAHQYVYRGLFDFDNFIYLFYTHKFKLDGFFGSILKTPYYPKIDSESLLPDENLLDWNHYMIYSHRM